MNLTSNFKRRIRIEGGADQLHGRNLVVHDVETGEQITNVTRAIIYLDAREMNQAELTYYEMDENNNHIVRDDEPIEGKVIVDNPEIAVTAIEQY